MWGRVNIANKDWKYQSISGEKKSWMSFGCEEKKLTKTNDSSKGFWKWRWLIVSNKSNEKRGKPFTWRMQSIFERINWKWVDDIDWKVIQHPVFSRVRVSRRKYHFSLGENTHWRSGKILNTSHSYCNTLLNTLIEYTEILKWTDIP